VAETQSMSDEEIMSFQGVVECEPPNEHLYKFNSKMWPTMNTDDDGAAIALSSENMILQATELTLTLNPNSQP